MVTGKEKVWYEYYEKFHEDFPFGWGHRSDEEALVHAKQCVRQGKRAAELYPDIYGPVTPDIVY